MIFNASRTDILKYVLLPQLWPRVRTLFGKGFQFIPYMIALVYQCVRLLPPSHPYTDPRNIGRFGVRHVVAEAANHLVVRARNIDQVILFGAVLLGIVLAVVQFFLLGLTIFIQPVLAGPTDIPVNYTEFFLLPDAAPQDLAYMTLDLVFGVPDVFNSCISGSSCTDMDGNPLRPVIVGGDSIFNQSAWPYPIHYAMHEVFRMYSHALLMVAVIITLYFMFTVVAETAQTGTAFGKRFNKVWAPLRIVVAFGLLVPIGDSGLNSSQYLVLYTAKYGTAFASKGWLLFNQKLNSKYKEDTEQLIGKPQVPEAAGLLQFMFVARTCYEADLINNTGTTGTAVSNVKPYAVRGLVMSGQTSFPIDNGSDYSDFVDFMGGDNVATIRFGVKDPKAYARYKGGVAPVCGEMTFFLTDSRPAAEQEAGTRALQEEYFNIIRDLWHSHWGAPGSKTKPYNHACNYLGKCGQKGLPTISEAEMSADRTAISTKINTAIGTAVTAMNGSARFTVDPELIRKGWPAAAIWYNRIAEMNGAVTTATFRLPMISLFPEAMEYVRIKKMQYDQEVSPDERYKPLLGGNKPVNHPDPTYMETMNALYNAYHPWKFDGGGANGRSDATGNAVIDTINYMFGTSGLYSMRNNPGVHPLGQLSALGKSLMDAAINNIGLAAGAAVGGGAMNMALSPFFGMAGKMASDLLVTFAMIALTAGFILFYVVPFLPFIYFFFAFGGWIKAVFEAMVGAPLWALAHIRIDGEGLPGKAALGGYFLLLEIFLRPILTIFGFIASITIFAAMVETLNEIFTLVTSNVSGFDVKAEEAAASPSRIEYYRGPVDEFFYTIVYAIIVYMLGLSSFKLIDQIPANILRWMGQSVAPFGGIGQDDPAEGLINNSNMGLQQGLPAFGQGMQKIGGAISNMGNG